MILFKKKPKTIQRKEELKVDINDIISILKATGHSPQATIMESALIALEMNNDLEFIRISKSIDIWGGSGAVWEVNIDDISLLKRFYNKLLNFCDILIENNIKNHWIRSRMNLLNRLVI
jgi:hypothetical protein